MANKQHYFFNVFIAIDFFLFFFLRYNTLFRDTIREESTSQPSWVTLERKFSVDALFYEASWKCYSLHVVFGFVTDIQMKSGHFCRMMYIDLPSREILEWSSVLSACCRSDFTQKTADYGKRTVGIFSLCKRNVLVAEYRAQGVIQ